MTIFQVGNIESKTEVVQDRRFACPGLFRMPAANDGGICRIKLPLGQLTTAQIDGVADAAKAYSNGHIELTTRGNIQIRGVAKNNEKSLIKTLLQLGLGPLTPEGDDIRNVMVAPTAGIDLTMSVDTTKLGGQLLEMLQFNREFAALSPKFSFLINGGETTSVHDHIADIWLAALPDGKTFNFGFASSVNDNYDGKTTAVGNIPAGRALDIVRFSLECFILIAKKNPAITRMKHLCQSNLYSEFLSDLTKRFGNKLSKPLFLPRKQGEQSPLTGIFPQKNQRFFYIGARPELGRLSSQQLRAISRLVQKRSAGTPLRLTHHQGIIVPDCSSREAQTIKDGLSEIGLAVDEKDPALHIFCCAGTPLCHSGLSNVQRDGKYLIDHFSIAPKADIHLTACQKACVATVAFPYTALAIKDGLYDLYCADDTEKHKFGRLLCQNMTISDVLNYLETFKNKA